MAWVMVLRPGHKSWPVSLIVVGKEYTRKPVVVRMLRQMLYLAQPDQLIRLRYRA
jgi:hypothetical protein